MANRYFNKQVAESRKPLAHGGPADKIKKATPMPIEVDLSNPRDKVRPNPRKELKPFSKFQEPMPKSGRPSSRPMPKDPIDKMEPRRPMPKSLGSPKRPKELTPEQIKRLKEQMKKRKIKSRGKKYAPEFKKKATLLPKLKGKK